MNETFRAVYENGVLKPLRPIGLKEKSRVLVAVYPESEWRDDFERLFRRMKAQSKGVSQQMIEAEITRARAEVRAKRRAARRPA